MKKSILYLLLILTFAACKSKNNQEAEISDSTVVDAPDRTTVDTTFKIEDIALSGKELGTFPYLTPPAKYSYNYHQEANAKDIKASDKEYFAVNGKLIVQEGKTFKTNVEVDRSNGTKFNSEDVLKSYKDQILSLGGVQVNDGEIKQAEYDRVGKTELIDKQFGFTLDPNLLDRIKTFVIRTKDKVVWVQLCLLNEESGRITVLEKI